MRHDRKSGPPASGTTSPPQKRRILFVEDMDSQMLDVVSLLESSGEWDIKVLQTPAEAIRWLEGLSHREIALPDIVSIDLGLANLPDDPDHGLSLLKQLHQRWEGLPLVVHSSRVQVSEGTVRQVLAQGASYFFLGDKDNLTAYINMLPYIAQGYVVFSPTPAGRLPKVGSIKPDPFARNPEYWGVLSLLSRGRTYAQIATVERACRGAHHHVARQAHGDRSRCPGRN